MKVKSIQIVSKLNLFKSTQIKPAEVKLIKVNFNQKSK